MFLVPFGYVSDVDGDCLGRLGISTQLGFQPLPRLTLGTIKESVYSDQNTLPIEITMQTTTISKLKTSLSAYLRQVKAGEEVIITEYGRPVARLLPPSQVSLPEHLQDMEKAGLVRRGKQPLPDDFWDLLRPSDPQAAVRSAVVREREEGR